MANEQPPTERFPFFQLPFELRILIYHELVRDGRFPLKLRRISRDFTAEYKEELFRTYYLNLYLRARGTFDPKSIVWSTGTPFFLKYVRYVKIEVDLPTLIRGGAHKIWERLGPLEHMVKLFLFYSIDAHEVEESRDDIALFFDCIEELHRQARQVRPELERSSALWVRGSLYTLKPPRHWRLPKDQLLINELVDLDNHVDNDVRYRATPSEDPNAWNALDLEMVECRQFTQEMADSYDRLVLRGQPALVPVPIPVPQPPAPACFCTRMLQALGIAVSNYLQQQGPSSSYLFLYRLQFLLEGLQNLSRSLSIEVAGLLAGTQSVGRDQILAQLREIACTMLATVVVVMIVMCVALAMLAVHFVGLIWLVFRLALWL